MPVWKQHLSTLHPEGKRALEDSLAASETVEELFDMDSGWAVEVLGADDDDDDLPEEVKSGLQSCRCTPHQLTPGMQQDDDAEDIEAEELGMAARSILRSIPRHRLRALETLQADAEEANAATRANARRRTGAEHKTHARLRIVGGAFAGKRLLSGRGETTRPMMEKVGSGAAWHAGGELPGCGPAQDCGHAGAQGGVRHADGVGGRQPQLPARQPLAGPVCRHRLGRPGGTVARRGALPVCGAGRLGHRQRPGAKHPGLRLQ